MSGVRATSSIDMSIASDTDLLTPKKKWSYKKIGLITGGILVAVVVITVLVVVLTGDDDDDKTTLAPTTATTTTTTTMTTTTDDGSTAQTGSSSGGTETIDPGETTPTTDDGTSTQAGSSSGGTETTDPGETTPIPPEPEELTLNDFLQNTLSSRRFSSRWVSGADVLVNDAVGLKLRNVLDDTEKILLARESDGLLAKASTYTLSPDNTNLLVGYDRIKGYRHSYEASYSVVELIGDDVKSKVAGEETKIFINDETDKLTLVEWSPTGQGLVIIFKNNIYYKPDLVTDPIQITSDGDNKIFNGIPDWVYEEEVFGSNSALRFSPDGTKLAYIRFDDSGVETFEYAYYGEPGSLDAQYPEIRQITYPKVGTTNPTVTAFQVVLPTTESATVTPVNIPVPTPLAAADHIITTLSWANDEQVVATWMNRVQNDAYIQVCDISPDCFNIQHVQSNDGWVELFSSPLYNEDGNQFALILSQDQGNNAGGYRHLTLLSTNDNNQIVLTKGKYVVTQLLHWDTEINYIFYSANTEEDSRVSHIYAIKAEEDAVPQCLTCDLVSLGGGNYQYFSASFSNGGKLFGLNALGPDVPRAEIYSYTLTENLISLVQERVWETNENLRDRISKLDMPTVEFDDEIVLSSGYNAQVSMILPRNLDKSGDTKYPVLINVYGGPDSYSVTFQWGTNWGTYLASAKDIIYVRIDGRGSGLRGDKLMHEIYRKLGTVEIEDQIETAKLLADKYPFIDRNHMAIWGWSYGGYAAGLALAKDTEAVFRCAVSVAPVTDWTYYDTIYTERYMGLPTNDDNEDGYASSRLSTLYQEFDGKNYFLIHGNLDDNVHYQQAMALSRTLETNGILFKQMSYPDEDHSLSGVLPHLYNTLDHYLSDCFHVEDPVPPEPEELTLNDFLRGTLSSRRFSSRWVSGADVLVNDAVGLKLRNVLDDTEKILLARESDGLLAKASTYTLSPDNTNLLVGYDRIKGYRHSYEASYSVVELIGDDVKSKVAGEETKIFINDETDKLTLVEWSPTGQGLVIIFKNNIYYKPDLVTDPLQITSDGDNKIFNGIPDWVYEEEVFGSNSALRFSPDGTKLAYIRFDDSGVETFEYAYYGEPGSLDAQYPEIRQITYPKVGTTNPTVTAFQVVLPTTESATVTPVNIPVPTPLAAADHIITTLSWANDEQVVATWMNRVQNDAYIQVCDISPDCFNIQHVQSNDGWVELFSSPLYNEDGNQFALILSQDQGNNAGGYRHLTLLSTNDNNQIVLTKGKYVVTQLLHWDTEINYIFYSANTEEDSRVSHIYAIKAEEDAVPQCLTCDLVSLGGGNYQYFSASFSNGGKLFGLNALGPDVPRAEIYSYTLTENLISLVQERVWETNENLRDRISKLDMPTVEFDDEIVLSSGYNAQVSMILPRNLDKSGDTKYPVLINVYGGPDSYSVTFQWGTNWGTYLASAKDIIYVRIDGRGSGLRGDKLMHEIYRKLGTVEIEDQIETAKLLADKYPFIDRNHMAIWGWSYGGYAAGLALAKDTEAVFRCAVSVAPVTDWTYYDTIYTERYMGLPTNDDNEDGYASSRLSTLYQEFDGKNYFLIHGNLDDNVHYQQAMALSRTLETNGILFKQMSYPDEDHSLSGVLPHLYNTLDHYFSDCFHLEH